MNTYYAIPLGIMAAPTPLSRNNFLNDTIDKDLGMENRKYYQKKLIFTTPNKGIRHSSVKNYIPKKFAKFHS